MKDKNWTHNRTLTAVHSSETDREHSLDILPQSGFFLLKHDPEQTGRSSWQLPGQLYPDQTELRQRTRRDINVLVKEERKVAFAFHIQINLSAQQVRRAL